MRRVCILISASNQIYPRMTLLGFYFWYLHVHRYSKTNSYNYSGEDNPLINDMSIYSIGVVGAILQLFE